VFDGENWWDQAPELWNWWDTSKPGYNASNINNVEWWVDPSLSVPPSLLPTNYCLADAYDVPQSCCFSEHETPVCFVKTTGRAARTYTRTKNSTHTHT
jgi:hypothetical protein